VNAAVPALLAAAMLGVLGCEGPTRPEPIVIPGPSVPSPLPTAAPYVWDTRVELAIWVNNVVARGEASIEGGDGADAYIRLPRVDQEWQLRGPDLSPIATGVRTLRIRYRLFPEPALSPTAVRKVAATALFESPGTLRPWYTGQPAAHADLEPSAEWVERSFTPGQYAPPIDVSYCYLRSNGGNRGVLEIDWLELVQ